MKTYTKNIQQPSSSAVLSPQWVYDTLMESIEPELMSDSIGKLDEKYEGEDEGDRAARMGRYHLAFMILDECLDDIATDMKVNELDLKGQMNLIAARESAHTDAQSMHSIEGQIENSSSNL